jgi:hypothetical protein
MSVGGLTRAEVSGGGRVGQVGRVGIAAAAICLAYVSVVQSAPGVHLPRGPFSRSAEPIVASPTAPGIAAAAAPTVAAVVVPQPIDRRPSSRPAAEYRATGIATRPTVGPRAVAAPSGASSRSSGTGPYRPSSAPAKSSPAPSHKPAGKAAAGAKPRPTHAASTPAPPKVKPVAPTKRKPAAAGKSPEAVPGIGGHGGPSKGRGR